MIYLFPPTTTLPCLPIPVNNNNHHHTFFFVFYISRLLTRTRGQHFRLSVFFFFPSSSYDLYCNMVVYATIINVTFPFGLEFTRLSIARLFDTIGVRVGEILLDGTAGRAVVALPQPYDLQHALLHLHGLLLFGRPIRLAGCPPPTIALPFYFPSPPLPTGSRSSSSSSTGSAVVVVTLRPTRMLLVQRVSLVTLALFVRRWKGVTRWRPLTPSSAVVEASSVSAAVRLRSGLRRDAAGHVDHHHGGGGGANNNSSSSSSRHGESGGRGSINSSRRRTVSITFLIPPGDEEER